MSRSQLTRRNAKILSWLYASQVWTLPQWVDVHLQTMEEHLAAMKKIKPALEALYQALTPEQRQKADQLIRMR